MENQIIAERIRDAIMTNGNGDEAERLVLELPGGRDGGGWGREALAKQIEAILDEMEVTENYY